MLYNFYIDIILLLKLWEGKPFTVFFAHAPSPPRQINRHCLEKAGLSIRAPGSPGCPMNMLPSTELQISSFSLFPIKHKNILLSWCEYFILEVTGAKDELWFEASLTRTKRCVAEEPN